MGEGEGRGGEGTDTPLPKAVKEVLILTVSSKRAPSAPLAFTCGKKRHVIMEESLQHNTPTHEHDLYSTTLVHCMAFYIAYTVQITSHSPHD